MDGQSNKVKVALRPMTETKEEEEKNWEEEKESRNKSYIHK